SHTTGTATVSGTLNSGAIGHNATVTFTPGATNAAQSTISASPTSVSVDVGTSAITVQAKDQYGNNRTTGGDTVTLATTLGTIGAITDNLNGTYSATLTSHVTGTATVSGTLNTVTIGHTATVTFTPGATDAGQSTISASPTSVSVDVGTSAITVQAKDQYGNNRTTGGDAVSLATTL